MKFRSGLIAAMWKTLSQTQRDIWRQEAEFLLNKRKQHVDNGGDPKVAMWELGFSDDVVLLANSEHLEDLN